MNTIGRIDVEYLFSQVPMLVTERQLDRDMINILDSRLNDVMDSFKLNYNYTDI